MCLFMCINCFPCIYSTEDSLRATGEERMKVSYLSISGFPVSSHIPHQHSHSIARTMDKLFNWLCAKHASLHICCYAYQALHFCLTGGQVTLITMTHSPLEICSNSCTNGFVKAAQVSSLLISRQWNALKWWLLLTDFVFVLLSGWVETRHFDQSDFPAITVYLSFDCSESHWWKTWVLPVNLPEMLTSATPRSSGQLVFHSLFTINL